MWTISSSVEKQICLMLVLVMVVSFGGFSISWSPSSEDGRVILDSTMGPTQLAWEDLFGSIGPRPDTQVRLELIADPAEELTPTTIADQNLMSPKPEEGEPQGGSDPFPDDSPFGGDILVYDNPNNQKRPNMDRDSNDYLYSVFEHDEGGNLDVYVARSTDGGDTWTPTAIANSANDEACPSIAIGYSPDLGTEMYYIFYEAEEFEFAWSNDGVNWNKENFGGGHTFWQYISCPYVAVKNDAVVLVAERYNQIDAVDTWYILYSLDSFQTGPTGYYFVMMNGLSIYRPRVTIIDSDEVIVAMVVRVDSGPYYDAMLAPGTLTGSMPTDDWPRFDWVSFWENDDYTNPAVQANNREVVFSMELFTPAIGPFATRIVYCMYTTDYQYGSTTWNKCLGPDSFLAFDPSKNQRNPMFHRDGSSIYVTWINGTDINFRYSPDGGSTWLGEPGTGLPLKVNQEGAGSAYLAWHSPDITLVGGEPGIIWHDTRGGGSIYFNTISDEIWFDINVEPSFPDIYVREVGDPVWHSPPHSYLWKIGSSHSIETLSSYQVPGGPLLEFCHWSDGNTSNPHTITVPATNSNITAHFCCPQASLTVDTSPLGLDVNIDDVAYTSPAVFCCSVSDVFKLHAPSPQPAGPQQGYYFSHWSDGGDQIHNVTITGNITVTAYFDLLTNQPPVADANGPYFERKNFPVNFTGAGSYDPDGTIVSYEWDFGDGSASGFGITITHTYSSGGIFDVVLNVTDDNGSVSSDATEAAIPDYAPDAPEIVNAVLTNSLLDDVEITWSLSKDDGGVENDVVMYEVYYGTGYDQTGASYTLLGSVPGGSSSYVHSGGGHLDPNNYFYRVCAVDDKPQMTCSWEQAAKFARYLPAGEHLVSIPLALSEYGTDVVFQTVDYSRITYYNATAGPGDRWQVLDTDKPWRNIQSVDRTMALWVEVVLDSQFTVAGLVPPQISIHLVKGWNFVGYPSINSSYTVAHLKSDTGALRVEGYDSSGNPYHTRLLSDVEILEPGFGYWILVDTATDWVVKPS